MWLIFNLGKQCCEGEKWAMCLYSKQFKGFNINTIKHYDTPSIRELWLNLILLHKYQCHTH